MLGGLLWAAALPQAQARQARKEPERVRRAAEREAALARARQALAQGDLPAAGAALKEATRLEPAAPPLFLLGELAQAEGRPEAAQDLMRRYLHETEADQADPAAQEKDRARAQALVAAARGARGEIRVVGERHALLALDGHLHGTLPLSLPISVPPGTYAVSLRAAGRTASGQVQVRAGASAEMVFQLRTGVVAVRTKSLEEADQDRARADPAPKGAAREPTPAPLLSAKPGYPTGPAGRTERAPRPIWRLGTGAAIAAVGVNLLAVGLPALALEGQCTQPIMPPAEVCPELYATGSLGFGLTLSGVLLTAGGVALMAWPGPRRTVVVTPGPGQAGLAVKGAF